MVVSASTNQVWTKITIGSYAQVFCHSESETSSVKALLYAVWADLLGIDQINYWELYGISKAGSKLFVPSYLVTALAGEEQLKYL